MVMEKIDCVANSHDIGFVVDLLLVLNTKIFIFQKI
jgi:hypothetical protein